jgi:Mandelate racemase / muconate lactonizing enzyme, N-terminal domain
MDPSRIEHIWRTLWRGQFFHGGHLHAAAVPAIEIGLWGPRGKALGVPVYDLLGAVAALHQLRAGGIPLALVTNTISRTRRPASRTGVAGGQLHTLGNQFRSWDHPGWPRAASNAAGGRRRASVHPRPCRGAG